MARRGGWTGGGAAAVGDGWILVYRLLSARDVYAAETHSKERMLWTIFWASDFFPCFMRQFVRRSSVGSMGGGRLSVGYPLAGAWAGGAGEGAGKGEGCVVKAEGDVRSRIAVNPEGGGGAGTGASWSRLAGVASRLIAVRGERSDIGGGESGIQCSSKRRREKKHLPISHYVT